MGAKKELPAAGNVLLPKQTIKDSKWHLMGLTHGWKCSRIIHCQLWLRYRLVMG